MLVYVKDWGTLEKNTRVKCYSGPHTAPGSSMNLGPHSVQRISISTHFPQQIFSLPASFCAVFYTWMEEHTKAQECPNRRRWWLLTHPVPTSDLQAQEGSLSGASRRALRSACLHFCFTWDTMAVPPLLFNSHTSTAAWEARGVYKVPYFPPCLHVAVLPSFCRAISPQLSS